MGFLPINFLPGITLLEKKIAEGPTKIKIVRTNQQSN